MTTNAYIDGFNLYYGSLRGTPYRWIDVSKLLALLLPNHRINRIRYFTARVTSSQHDPTKEQRQRTYIRALRTIPNLSIHFGHFLTNRVRMPLAYPVQNAPRTVEVIKTEEKGSDVNLATYLLVDGFRKDYDTAVVVSNDSDLVTPIEFVMTELGITVGVLNPQKNTSWALRNTAGFYRKIRSGPLSASLFPDTIRDARGKITKPIGLVNHSWWPHHPTRPPP